MRGLFFRPAGVHLIAVQGATCRNRFGHVSSDSPWAFDSKHLGPTNRPAQQGARANVHIGHASCYPTLFRFEVSDRVSEQGTSHARCGRGSSLTLGVSAPISQFTSEVTPNTIRQAGRPCEAWQLMAPSPPDTESSSNARIGCSLRMSWPGELCRISRGSMLIPARGSVGTLSELHSLFIRSLVLSFVHVRHFSNKARVMPAVAVAHL